MDPSRQGEAGGAHPDDWLCNQDYKLLPLCQAVLIILDVMPLTGARIKTEKEAQRQNVHTIGTTDGAGLSVPFDIDTIRSGPLLLAGPDVNFDESDNVIRISLRTAAKFISDLQQREEMTFPNVRRKNNNRSARADSCVTKILRKVDRRASSNVTENDFTIDEIEAKEQGPPLYEKASF